jgi:hypothetical protein
MTMHYSKKISVSVCLALLVVAAACGRKSGNDTVGTTGTSTVRVTDATVGRAIGGDKAIADKTETFAPNDTIYVSVATDGSSPSASLRAKWTFEDGQVVDESTRAIAQTNTHERTEFHISKPDGFPAGKYKVEVFLNDVPAESKNFEVRAR